MVKLLLACMLCCTLHGEEPWGRDAFLLPRTKVQKPTPSTPLAQAISFHQRILSSADGPRSHFYPTSSEYGRKAIEQFGVGTGLLMTFDRLMRENGETWVYKVYRLDSKILRKYDPVPTQKAQSQRPK